MKLNGAEDVHVWQIDLESNTFDPYFSVLSKDEQAKAARYHTRQLQLHYARGRCALRLLLAPYLGIAAADLVFEYGAFGKPALAAHLCTHLHFNLSHSEQFALIGIAADTIGVDLEYMHRPNLDVASLINIVLHPWEKAAFALLSVEQQASFFYATWARKEAYCKALGVGLQATLKNLHIERVGRNNIGRVHDENGAQVDTFYSYVLDLPNADQRYSASICLKKSDAIINLRNCPQAHDLILSTV